MPHEEPPDIPVADRRPITNYSLLHLPIRSSHETLNTIGTIVQSNHHTAQSIMRASGILLLDFMSVTEFKV